MPNNTAKNFAERDKVVIVAPAGCGKTELIADSIEHCDGRQLILTHTHAGVNSLRKRLKKKGVPSKKYRLETIHSFALRYASAYPKASGIITNEPETNEEYENVITSATSLLEKELAKKILEASYTGVFVDEYQDCTVGQHKLILKLAKIMRCRIVGDYLQGIFDFGGSELVDWVRDVDSNFESLDKLNEPWRWKKGGNEALGSWLIDTARPAIEKSESLALHGLESIGIHWHPKPSAYTSGLREHAKSFDSIFAISAPENINKPHSIVKNLKNWYRSIEPLTAKDLFKYAKKISAKDGTKLLDEVLAFAYKCLTKITTDCNFAKARLSKEVTNNDNREQLRIYFNSIVEGDCKSILELFDFLEIYKPTYKRWQLWLEMKKALRLSMAEKMPLVEACWQVKNKTKYYENRIPRRCVSRTVLLKGLECECVAVIDADELKRKDFYVAITRPSKELHIYSTTPFYPSISQDQMPDCPECHNKLRFLKGPYGIFMGCSNYPECEYKKSFMGN